LYFWTAQQSIDQVTMLIKNPISEFSHILIMYKYVHVNAIT